jgi:competence protein ComEC
MTGAATPSRRIVSGLITGRPAVPVAVLFALGIVAHSVVPHRPWVWLAGIAAVLVPAWCIWRTMPRVCSALIAFGFAAAGLATGQLGAFYFPRGHVSAFASAEPRLAQLELQLDQAPRVLTFPFAPHHPLPPRQVTTAAVTRVKTTAGWDLCSGSILVQIAEPHPGLAINQTVRVTGMLQRPAPAMNPGQFDWAEYYRGRGTLASLAVPHAQNIKVLTDPGPGPLMGLREGTRNLLAAGFPADGALDHALLRALLLGDDDPQLRDVQEQFQQTGTSHHLAISGMHVAVLGGFVYLLCRLLCLSPRTGVVAMTLFVVLYGLVALPSPPVVRSVILCIAFGIGIVSRRAIDALQLLALSVLAMLVYQPLDLYRPGFQLSFGTVLGLVLFTRPMRRMLRKDVDHDRAVAESFDRRPGVLRAAARWADNGFIKALAAGLVAWGVSLPLVAYHFEQLNPWAVVAGILLAPLVLAALVCGLLKVVLTLLWPGAAGAWAALAAAPVAAMRQMVDWLAHLPMGDVPVPPPPVWLMLVFYALLVPALWPCHRAGLRWCLRGGRFVVLLLIVLLPFQIGFAPANAGPGYTRVTLLAVGAGQCAVVEPPSGRTVLIDAGSTSLSDLSAKCLGPFLRHRRHTSVDTVIISHTNYDHFSAAADVVSGYGAREVLTAATFARQAEGNAPVESLLAGLAELQRPPRILSPGDRIPLGRETTIEVLWPPVDLPEHFEPNDSSIVLRLRHTGRSILFTGDIQEPAMRELLEAPHLLKADVLVAPHHGSVEASTAQFIAAVNPSVIVSSNDRSLSGKQKGLRAVVGNRPLFRTHECGAITITFGPDGRFEVQPFLKP